MSWLISQFCYNPFFVIGRRFISGVPTNDDLDKIKRRCRAYILEVDLAFMLLYQGIDGCIKLGLLVLFYQENGIENVRISQSMVVFILGSMRAKFSIQRFSRGRIFLLHGLLHHMTHINQSRLALSLR